MTMVVYHTPIKKSISPVQATTNPCWLSKGQTILQNPWNSMQKLNINIKNINPTCPLHGPRQDMTSFKVIQLQYKYMKSTFLSDRGGGGGFRVKIVGDKKRLANDEEINMISVLSIAKALKINKKSKYKATEKYDS